ncbi:dehydrogenase [Roseibium aquae]|uniref:Dehydrogenase n=1 Tax=Roseibium aquae TaxID=1323746 RepID=A0A916TL44_9HYPH|nr:PQQ-dependent sugar dehydrogenase [Roseibium aquae]GGB51949.1 dehydrogenase [Roseibium aquae]
MSKLRSILPLVAALALGFPAAANAQADLAIETVTDGLSSPWAVAFLPDGGFLVTERDGTLKHVTADGRQTPVAGVPEVFAQGQGGLLDVAIAPDFASTREVYLSFSEGSPEGAGTSVFRGTLVADGGGFALRDGETVFSGNNRGFGGRHFGSRLAFAPDGTLFVTTGDRGDRPSAQDTSNHAGSVLRINRDGSVPSDNPFVGRSGYLPELWSIGHRNVQSAAIHPGTGNLWTVEHGARGGDEVNRPEAGRNYGWPVISYGRHYSGGTIGEGTSMAGMEQPVHYWDPSIAPSGMAFVTSPLFPQWQGSLLVGALAGQHLARLDLDGTTVAGEEKLLAALGERIRDVRQGPDGAIYVLTDSGDGRLLRLTPGT